MAKARNWTHSELVTLAVKWLMRNHGANGAGCRVAVSEFPTGYNGEIPDAIGFRASGYLDGSTLVEVKVSRSDFRADAKKPHRSGERLGVGRWRYYMAPKGLIRVEELPLGWGLLEVTNRGGVKCVAGPLSVKGYDARKAAFALGSFEVDTEREAFLLVRLLARVGNTEELNLKLRQCYRLQDQVVTLERENKELRREQRAAKRRLKPLPRKDKKPRGEVSEVPH